MNLQQNKQPNKDVPKKNYELTIKVQNSMDIDPEQPIDVYTTSWGTTIAGKRYIPFIGRDDNLPNLLLNARLTSPTQNACISTIAKSTIGKGLVVKGKDNISNNLLRWMKSVNNARQPLSKVLLGTVDGERTYGNQFIEVVRGTIGNQRYLKVYNHSMHHSRLVPSTTNDDIPAAVVISKSIAKKGYISLNKDVEPIPLWSPNPLDNPWYRGSNGDEHTMLHFKNEISGVEYYGMPASAACFRHQLLEGKAAQFNIDNFDNNMILGGMLIFASAMTQEEAEKQAEEILMTHVGAGKTGRIAVVSSENGIKDVTFTPFNTQKEGSFMELAKQTEKEIIKSNDWDALLLGGQEGSSLGRGGTLIRAAWDTKEASLLNPLRDKLIQEVVSPIMAIYADWFGEKEVADYEWEFKSSMPFSFMGDINPELFMQVDEARSLAGLMPDEKMKGKYLSEMKKGSNDVQTQPDTEKGTDNNR